METSFTMWSEPRDASAEASDSEELKRMEHEGMEAARSALRARFPGYDDESSRSDARVLQMRWSED